MVSLSVFKYLASLEVHRLLGVSRASSKESRRTYLFLTIFNGVLHVRNAVCMSLESSVSILKSLATLEVPSLLGVSRASSKESRRICFVPDCSQWCITHQECSMHVTRKLYENLQVISCKFCS